MAAESTAAMHRNLAALEHAQWRFNGPLPRRPAPPLTRYLDEVARTLADVVATGAGASTAAPQAAVDRLCIEMMAAADAVPARLIARDPKTLAPLSPAQVTVNAVVTHADATRWLEAEGRPFVLPSFEPPPQQAAGATAPAPMRKGPKTQRVQEEELLEALVALGHDPLHLPPAPKGKTCPVKAAARARVGWTTAIFEHAWERLSC
ncbi:MAG: hypothetical protein IT499_13815 [Rubrivivax sp.]|nr:hypothetical protein [Rubrivivax sp.]MCL4699553.1 hypothetical protein [Burkholderiaceae bacterium]